MHPWERQQAVVPAAASPPLPVPQHHGLPSSMVGDKEDARRVPSHPLPTSLPADLQDLSPQVEGLP